MKTIKIISLSILLINMCHAKPMTDSVKSWEGEFKNQTQHIVIYAEKIPKLFMWLYELNKGSKGTCIGFSRANGDMIYSPRPNEQGVQPIYHDHVVILSENKSIEVIITYKVQGNDKQKIVEKYIYDGNSIKLDSQMQFFGRHNPVWKKTRKKKNN